MKRNILKTVLLILMLFGMFLINNIYQSPKELVFVNNECKLQNSTRFTISMWVKPINNEFYNKILKIYNDSSSIYLLNNTEDDNYKLTGITITSDERTISNSNNYHLNVNEWSNIVNFC